MLELRKYSVRMSEHDFQRYMPTVGDALTLRTSGGLHNMNSYEPVTVVKVTKTTVHVRTQTGGGVTHIFSRQTNDVHGSRSSFGWTRNGLRRWLYRDIPANVLQALAEHRERQEARHNAREDYRSHVSTMEQTSDRLLCSRTLNDTESTLHEELKKLSDDMPRKFAAFAEAQELFELATENVQKAIDAEEGAA